MKVGNADCRTSFNKRGYWEISKKLDSTYAKEYLKQVENNATQMDAEEITQLLRLLEYLEDSFDGTLGDWDTDP